MEFRVCREPKSETCSKSYFAAGATFEKPAWTSNIEAAQTYSTRTLADEAARQIYLEAHGRQFAKNPPGQRGWRKVHEAMPYLYGVARPSGSVRRWTSIHISMIYFRQAVTEELAKASQERAAALTANPDGDSRVHLSLLAANGETVDLVCIDDNRFDIWFDDGDCLERMGPTAVSQLLAAE